MDGGDDGSDAGSSKWMGKEAFIAFMSKECGHTQADAVDLWHGMLADDKIPKEKVWIEEAEPARLVIRVLVKLPETQETQ